MQSGASIISELLNRFAVADVIDTLAYIAAGHPKVPGGASISYDLKRIAGNLDLAAWRKP